MTHSLLSSWLYAMSDYPYADMTTEYNSMEEFLKVLRREPTETTEAMQNGIIFEDLITAILQGNETFGFFEMYDQDSMNGLIPAETSEHKWYEASLKAANRVRGGTLQFKAYKQITVNGMDFLVHGRLDVLKAGEIIDIKFSKGYDRGKYFDSTQHPMYFELVPEAGKFTYLVSNGNEVWEETYRRDEAGDIKSVISDFVDWLNATGYMALYMEHWAA